MDLDALATARHDDWQRLDALARASGRLSGPEADELIERYQAGASDLSLMQTTAGSTALGDRLSITLAKARLRFTGAPRNPLGQFTHFVVSSLPAALYRVRWLTLAVTVVTFAVSALVAWWLAADPRALANVGTEAELQQLADEGFVAYYSENPAASFAGSVWTNNAWIAAQCIAFGITGVWVPYVILQNAMNLGTTGAVMVAYDEVDTFFLHLAPHGLLELTCVFVAAAAGLRIFWSWVAPGRRTRSDALAEDARALFSVAIGLAFFLFVSGIIEAFVTPAPWPWPVKIGIGVLALAGFLAYMLVLGRRARLAGESGDLTESEAGARRIVAG
ncbi:stage II sporulation protein M [Agromyces aerolatus]|uniref:stage II sporulation protein M n=1 Tax=Agromyces sp. LY-1074 TaxID=3074080 RepID=UPI002855EFB9|nr:MULTISPECIES: stage II sporulation protein M [unclassified Agromyces]MDR5699845.1 stage II sporulation protein M [Agromyces sp. LY-1074]MDR5706343.1 stage II sporulation protein M [Agromyces sp. LY-1358]